LGSASPPHQVCSTCSADDEWCWAGDDQRRADAQGAARSRQRVLDSTANLKAVQKLLGHSSIQTTGDVYADWDINQLAATMADVLSTSDE
jgi:integrase